MQQVPNSTFRIVQSWLEANEALAFSVMVVFAALAFTVGGIFMKLSNGATRLAPSLIILTLFLAGAALQALAMKREDLAVTYLIVLGLESILAFLFGVLLFDVSCSVSRVAGVSLIAIGIAPLRFA